MADETIGKKPEIIHKRANPENILRKAAITMILLENAELLTEPIHDMLRRYVGLTGPMTVEEANLCGIINDIVYARELDGLDRQENDGRVATFYA